MLGIMQSQFTPETRVPIGTMIDLPLSKTIALNGSCVESDIENKADQQLCLMMMMNLKNGF